MTEETWAFEFLPGPARQVSRRRLRLERAAWHGALGGSICIVPAFLLYMARHSELLPADQWVRLLVEMTSFSIFAGTVHSSAIALGVSLEARGPLRVLGAMLLGALSGALVTAIGSAHFGAKPFPYLGGATLYLTIVIGVFVFATGHAHSETTPPSWRVAARCTLEPVPLVLAFVALCALLAPGMAGLDYATIRAVAIASGLTFIGAIGGAVSGAIVGLWIGSAVVLASRRCR